MDSGQAFAALLTSRMAELALSSDEVAERLDVSPAAVGEWIAGSVHPEDGDIEPLARVLSLPRSLVREACRRAGEARQALAVNGDDPTIGESVKVLAADATHHQPVPTVVTPAVMVDPSSPPDVTSRSAELLGSPWRLLRERIAEGRQRARAPVGEVSYLEDTDQRMTYQLRAMFTIGGVIAMMIILRWAFGGFGSALSDLWETLTQAL